MIYGIAIDAFYGTRVKRAYVCDHEGDGFMPLHDGLEAQYVTGHQPPNYPMPAYTDEVCVDLLREYKAHLSMLIMGYGPID